MNYNDILFTKEKGIAKITLNRPQVYNALNLTIRPEILHALEDVRTDEDVKVLVITGAGKAFCSGGDIKTMEGQTPVGGRERLKNLHRITEAIFNLEKPVITAVNGIAMGGGFSLALLGDIIVASEKARFSCSFVNIAVVPDTGMMWYLPRLIGLHKANELMFTGRVIDASEAMEMGLLNKVVPAEELEKSVQQIAERLTKGPIKAIGMMKTLTHKALWTDYSSFLEYEAQAQAICFMTEDMKEGFKSFLEKRAPQFKGR
jgi:2-(1,2-epoxy-1,2-dihydrophenyl)acetyl-CoA isomerase